MSTTPRGFTGNVNVARLHGDPIYGARVDQWTDQGVVIIYDTEQVPEGSTARKLAPVTLRRFIPFATMSSLTEIIAKEPEA